MKKAYARTMKKRNQPPAGNDRLPFNAKSLAGSLLTLLVLLASLTDSRAQGGIADAVIGETANNLAPGDSIALIKDTRYEKPPGAMYVSPRGNDATGDGTEARPFLTLKKAITAAVAGGTVVMRGGTYRAAEIDVNKRGLVIQPYPNEKVWFKGSRVVTGWVQEDGLWVKTGGTVYIPTKSEAGCAQCIDPRFPTANLREMVFFNGKSLKQVNAKSKITENTFYVERSRETANQKYYLKNDPTNSEVEITFSNTGLKVVSPDVVVRGLGFTHYFGASLLVYSPDVVLENNTFAWNSETGAGVLGRYGGTNRVVIRGNNFTYNGRMGLSVQNTDDGLIENNVFSYNNIERFANWWDAAGTKIIFSKNVQVRNNFALNNWSMGIWMDVNVLNARCINNFTLNNVFGIFYEVSKGAEIAGNISVGDASGIAISGASSVKAYNNTLINNVKPIYVKDTDRKNMNAEEVVQGIDWETRDVEIFNNIYSNATAKEDPFAMVDIGQYPCDASDPMIKAMDYNFYYRTLAGKPVNVLNWNPTGCANQKFTTLAAFKAAVPFEQNSKAIDDEAVNPFFIDAANSDYRLKQGSPAILAGRPLSESEAALLDLPAGVPVNMGASQGFVVVPPAPAVLTATVVSQRTVAPAWQDKADNETGYKVERSTAGGEFVTVATLAADADSYKDTGLSASTGYTYKITGFNEAGSSSSNQETVTTAAAGTGLLATYYKSKHFNGSSFTRTDATVNFDWGLGSPDASMSHNTFTIRWEGQVEAIYPETYTFKTITDDGVRLWVNGQLLIDDFTHRGLRGNTASLALEADRKYTIKLEYYENDDQAVAKLLWSSAGQPETIIPQTQLFPAAQPTAPAVAGEPASGEATLTAYPNPASGTVTLSFTAESDGQATISISTPFAGVQTLSYKISSGQNQLTIPVNHLRPGLYYFNVSCGNTHVSKGVVVTR